MIKCKENIKFLKKKDILKMKSDFRSETRSVSRRCSAHLIFWSVGLVTLKIYLIYDIFNIQLDRTPLHYAYLFMPQKDVIEKLVKAGAMKDRHDPVCVNSDVK